MPNVTVLHSPVSSGLLILLLSFLFLFYLANNGYCSTHIVENQVSTFAKIISLRQTTDKPGSVLSRAFREMNDHLSSLSVAEKFQRFFTTSGRAARALVSLQPTGFASSRGHPRQLRSLTPFLSPLPPLMVRELLRDDGGFVSVALSLRSRAVAVSDCRCPLLPGLSSRETVVPPAAV